MVSPPRLSLNVLSPYGLTERSRSLLGSATLKAPANQVASCGGLAAALGAGFRPRITASTHRGHQHAMGGGQQTLPYLMSFIGNRPDALASGLPSENSPKERGPASLPALVL